MLILLLDEWVLNDENQMFEKKKEKKDGDGWSREQVSKMNFLRYQFFDVEDYSKRATIEE